MLTPTIIYANIVLQLIKILDIHGLCHITGGGIIENVPRIIPNGFTANIDSNSWSWPEIFDWIKKTGKVDDEEMYQVFNCGIGMLVILPKNQADKAIAICQQTGYKAKIIGEIAKSTSNSKIILL